MTTRKKKKAPKSASSKTDGKASERLLHDAIRAIGRVPAKDATWLSGEVRSMATTLVMWLALGGDDRQLKRIERMHAALLGSRIGSEAHENAVLASIVRATLAVKDPERTADAHAATICVEARRRLGVDLDVGRVVAILGRPRLKLPGVVAELRGMLPATGAGSVDPDAVRKRVSRKLRRR